MKISLNSIETDKIDHCQLVYTVNLTKDKFLRCTLNIFSNYMVYRFTRVKLLIAVSIALKVVYKRLTNWLTNCKPRIKDNSSSKNINSTYICLMITTKISFDLFLNFNKSPKRVLFGRSQFGALSF